MRLIRIDSCDKCPLRHYNNGEAGYYGHFCDNKEYDSYVHHKDRHKTYKLDEHRGKKHNVGKSYRQVWKPIYEGDFPNWCLLTEI